MPKYTIEFDEPEELIELKRALAALEAACKKWEQ